MEVGTNLQSCVRILHCCRLNAYLRVVICVFAVYIDQTAVGTVNFRGAKEFACTVE